MVGYAANQKLSVFYQNHELLLTHSTMVLYLITLPYLQGYFFSYLVFFFPVTTATDSTNLSMTTNIPIFTKTFAQIYNYEKASNTIITGIHISDNYRFEK